MNDYDVMDQAITAKRQERMAMVKTSVEDNVYWPTPASESYPAKLEPHTFPLVRAVHNAMIEAEEKRGMSVCNPACISKVTIE